MSSGREVKGKKGGSYEKQEKLKSCLGFTPKIGNLKGLHVEMIFAPFPTSILARICSPTIHAL